MTKGKIIFTGNFGEYFLISLGLLVLTIVTLGLAGFYFMYWQVKYFVAHLEIELYPTHPERFQGGQQPAGRRIARG